MKKIYIIPTTDLVLVNSRQPVLVDIDVVGASKGATELGGNQGLFDEDEEGDDFSNVNTSLWDD